MESLVHRNLRARRLARAIRNPVESLERRLLLSTAVTTYHNDNQTTGVNSTETQLTPSSVNVANFGKHFSVSLDGQAYAQPLYIPALNITGGVVNTVHTAGGQIEITHSQSISITALRTNPTPKYAVPAGK